MNYKDLLIKNKEVMKERTESVSLKLSKINEKMNVVAKYEDFFTSCLKRISNLEEIIKMQENGKLRTLSLEELQNWNNKMYEEFYEKNYNSSYGNPAYAADKFGVEIGQILSFLYYHIAIANKAAYMADRKKLTIMEELFVRVYDCFENDNENISGQKIKSAIIEHRDSVLADSVNAMIRNVVDPEMDFIKEIVLTADFNDPRFLYWYGVHVSDNELKMIKFINTLPKSDIQAMADTVTEGYRIGFEITGKDISKKQHGEFIYALGLEPVVRAGIENFKKLNLETVIRTDRLQTTDANRQFAFDHKSDLALVFDDTYIDARLAQLKVAFENVKDKALGYAGPAVIETFGEKEFNPIIKKEAIDYTAKQREMNVEFTSKSRDIQSKYILEEERSFTIIAYPIPEIGEKFEEIFKETVKLNNLDYKLYQSMQQKIIDALDTAEYVHVTGKGENKTDIIVMMHTLENPEKQSNFENCVADVNIPVGEVFTSPKLTGTNGKLHVTNVYLNGLLFKNLEIDFKDGMIENYTCSNFKTEEENKKYMDENVMFHHKSLPIGEFAIGTNTVAYKMGIEFDIQDKLPILIAEKTGPHFAVGDTCYSHTEDVAVYNPDGKEIVARSNEVVETRHENPLKAYFNCHTDITIPYNELEKIVAIDKDGNSVDIIVDGRFVLAGIEKLNEPLDELENK